MQHETAVEIDLADRDAGDFALPQAREHEGLVDQRTFAAKAREVLAGLGREVRLRLAFGFAATHRHRVRHAAILVPIVSNAEASSFRTDSRLIPKTSAICLRLWGI